MRCVNLQCNFQYNASSLIKKEDGLFYLHMRMQGHLNQWTHWARAQGPLIFFFLRGPQLSVVNYFFKTNYLITFAEISCKGNPVNTF